MGQIAASRDEDLLLKLYPGSRATHNSQMTSPPTNLERAADMRADRLAFLTVAAFTILSWILLSTSEQMEAARDNQALPAIQPWLVQFASHLATLIVLPIVPFVLSRVRFSRGEILRTSAWLGAGFVAFGVLHILIMVALRKLLWPLAFDGHYIFGLADPLIWLYELRKDAYTYLLQLGIFILFRHVEQLRLDLKNRLQIAETQKRLTLKSGGRTLVLDVEDVVWAKAAANYVELHTAHKSHLVRISLTELARLIESAQPSHLRTHRSYLVKQDSIEEIVPDGEGGAVARLRTGIDVPIGRTYRETIKRALEENIRA